MGRLCRLAVDEVSASYPDAQINLEVSGRIQGRWDGDRISQLLTNLLVNGIQHGTGTIRIVASSTEDTVSVAVSNSGDPIPEQIRRTIFDPLTRQYSPPERRGAAAGAGLGLYICDCIAKMHRGEIQVKSDNQETTFTLALPRKS